MTKKTYQKPKMEIYEVIKTSVLQTTSPPGGGGGIIYIPRMDDDLNKLT